MQVTSCLGRGRQAQAAPDPGVERAQLVVAERVRERQHRPGMAHLAELAGELGTYPLGRRVGCDERGERHLERDELAIEAVVFGVAQLGGIFLVVEPARTLDRGSELGVAALGSLGAEVGGLLDERRIDGQLRGRHRQSI